nr:MAG TPA: hypothetical protein [Caudoviricetes sp.]
MDIIVHIKVYTIFKKYTIIKFTLRTRQTYPVDLIIIH